MTITRLTGFKPTGHLHLGNLLGAMRPLIAAQCPHRSIAMVADILLHDTREVPVREHQNQLLEVPGPSQSGSSAATARRS